VIGLKLQICRMRKKLVDFVKLICNGRSNGLILKRKFEKGCVDVGLTGDCDGNIGDCILAATI
jgi:hypothetical protein